MLRSRILPLLTSALSCTGQVRFTHDEETGNTKRKVNLDDDERWLEAEFDEKLRSPEERYAHERQREIMKSLIKKMRNEHKQHVESTLNARDTQINDLKQQIHAMEKKIQDITQKPPQE
ncbi:hypothetical protein, unlikely [Trypanosoma congolense IL3000]|uniref:Uncharacterized protein n=1 Tax=Trypanosoma congolense (strain IL3000) TaxID=1068625 RepID=F9WHH4_TRYCI|nr:hypothetical protein, unlikely [Trypanosoma congolense IL3000]